MAAVTVIVAMTTQGAIEQTLAEQHAEEAAILGKLQEQAPDLLTSLRKPIVTTLSDRFHAHIVLTDIDGRTLWDTGTGERPPEAGSITATETGPDGNVSKTPLFVFIGFSSGPSIPWALIGAIAAALVVIAALAAIPLANFVTRPLRKLAFAARAIRDGDLDVRVEAATPREVADLATSFNDMAAELARADSQRKQMTADIAHELRSPLTNILAHLDAIEDGVVDPTPDQIWIISSETVRLARLVEDLQTLAALDERNLTLRVVPTDICRAIDIAIEASRGRAAEKEVTIRRLGMCEAEVAVDPMRFGQIMGNLLDNGLEHTPERGEVTVAVRTGTQEVEVTVTDTGAGIDPEFLPHVFDRLSRSDPSRNPGSGGRGLGLTIARGLARAHGGDIIANNKPDCGAAFVVTLPLSGSH